MESYHDNIEVAHHNDRNGGVATMEPRENERNTLIPIINNQPYNFSFLKPLLKFLKPKITHQNKHIQAHNHFMNNLVEAK